MFSVQVFETRGLHENAITAANIDLANFPFMPVTEVLSLLAIGRCHAHLGRMDEARSTFKRALTKANKCRMRMLQLFAFEDSKEYAGGDVPAPEPQLRPTE